MKKRLLILTFIILCLTKVINVNAIVQPTENFYINDYANILSEETEKYILTNSVALERETTTQVVVVTVQNLEGKTIEEYAVQIYREYGIGTSEKNNGLLLLLALEEREFRVEVGYGLEEVLPDGLTGRYQDNYIIPYLKEDKWDEGIKNGYTAFIQKLCEYYNIDSLSVESVELQETDEEIDESDENTWYLRAALLGLFFGLILSFIKRANTMKTNDVKTKTLYTTITIIGNIASLVILGKLAGAIPVGIHIIAEIYIILNYGHEWHGTGFGRGIYHGGSNHGGSGGFRGGGGRSGGGGSTRRF